MEIRESISILSALFIGLADGIIFGIIGTLAVLYYRDKKNIKL